MITKVSFMYKVLVKAMIKFVLSNMYVILMKVRLPQTQLKPGLYASNKKSKYFNIYINKYF